MKRSLLLLLAGLTLTACGSYLVNSENVSKAKKPYAKVFVLAWSENNIARSLFESDVVKALEEKGIAGVRSLDSGIDIPVDHKPSESEAEAIGNAIKAQGFDGVVVINLVSREEYKTEVPGSYAYRYDPASTMYFGSYMGLYPAVTWEPGKQVTGTRFVLESTLYDLTSPKEENLQWIGWFEMEDPTDIRKTTARFAKELVGSLSKTSMARAR